MHAVVRKIGDQIVENGLLVGVVKVYEYLPCVGGIRIVLGKSLTPFGIFGTVKYHVHIVEVNDIFHFLGRQAPVDPDGDDAELKRSNLDEKAFGTVSRNDGQSAALCKTERAQIVRSLVDELTHLAVGDAPAFVNDGFTLGASGNGAVDYLTEAGRFCKKFVVHDLPLL